jgi:nitrite reductase/ring-hydroxylating ferredoxin subunit
MHDTEIRQKIVDRVLARRGRYHLFDSLDPAETALVVIDMQGTFVAPDSPAEVPSSRGIVVWKIADGFRGVQALCPHQEVSLMEATLMRDDTMIRCHRHNFIFRLDNGNGVNCRGLTMKVYEIRETNGKLEALVPS